MKQIQEDIKNNSYRSLYLLYGEEKFLLYSTRRKLFLGILGMDVNGGGPELNSSLNYTYFDNDNFNINAFFDISETLPFFSDRRLVVLDSVKMDEDTTDLFCDYLSRRPDYLVIVITCDTIDKRNRIYKYFDKNGYACEFEFREVSELLSWIASYLKKEGLRITRDSAMDIIRRSGEDMYSIRSELEKLTAYCSGRDAVLQEDVDAICPRDIRDRIFDMLEAVFKKRKDLAMKLYYDLIIIDSKPGQCYRILTMIVRELNIFFKVKDGMKNPQLDKNAIASAAGVNKWFVGKYMEGSRGLSEEYLKKMLGECGDLITESRKGRIDIKIGLDMLIVRMCSE